MAGHIGATGSQLHGCDYVMSKTMGSPSRSDTTDWDDEESEPQAIDAPDAKWQWVRERARSEEQIILRLQKSTDELELNEIFPDVFVRLVEDEAIQANCSTKVFALLLPAAIGAMAGPDVQVAVWHRRSKGFKLHFNTSSWIAAPSGSGKSNGLNLVKSHLSKAEEILKKQLLTSDYTLPSLKTRVNENKQALIVMDEGSRFRDMLATTQGDGTYRAQMLEMLDAQDVVSAAASCNIVRPHSAAWGLRPRPRARWRAASPCSGDADRH